jgi:hypothetical protein
VRGGGVTQAANIMAVAATVAPRIANEIRELFTNFITLKSFGSSLINANP